MTTSLWSKLRTVGGDEPVPVSLAERIGTSSPSVAARSMFVVQPADADLAAILEDPRVRQQLDETRRELAEQSRAELEGAQDALREQYAAGIGQLTHAAESMSQLVAETVVDLALVVASELVADELSRRRDVVMTVVGKALNDLGDSTGAVVRMCPSDAAQIAAAGGIPSTVTLVSDESLRAGDAVVEGARHVIDARTSTRLADMRRALVDLLRSEGGAI